MTKEQKNPFERGPYIQIATFCERVLRETDGVLSIIRIVDRVTHTERRATAPRDMPEFHYPLTLVLALKSGEARGRADVTITPELPSGETMPPVTTSVQMEGENRGVNVVSQIDIPFRIEGLYWFRIDFDGQPITRLPLEIRYSRLVAGPSTGESS
ncbi:MAG: hypothetical protein HYX92_10660 [Chloroflexi bacterium]|nr:hypothetical protein [Chloroflexota bacterium]